MPRKPLPDVFATDLIPSIHRLLQDLQNHPYPLVESPLDVPKRASVALILRIQPHYSHWPTVSEVSDQERSNSPIDRIDAFFSQNWVRHGDPEVLFIKRAANEHDKWTGHIAFPGGRRDPDDQDDREAAIRETWEEVGIDLREESGNAIYGGNLNQSVVTTSWGSKPLSSAWHLPLHCLNVANLGSRLLTFCPYIFLLTGPIEPLRLQPREVASAHWVPIRALLDPKYRTYWLQDMSARSSGQDHGPTRAFHRALTGDMIFAAIRLHPSESKFSTEIEEYAGTKELVEARGSNITVPLSRARAKLAKIEDSGASLLLWGLTLGVVGDFLDMLPPHDTLQTWIYPTFTPADLRFWLWLLSYNFRRRKEQEIQDHNLSTEEEIPLEKNMLVTVDGEQRYYGRLRADARGPRNKASMSLLPGYVPYIKRAALVAGVVRASSAILLAAYIARKLRGS